MLPALGAVHSIVLLLWMQLDTVNLPNGKEEINIEWVVDGMGDMLKICLLRKDLKYSDVQINANR